LSAMQSAKEAMPTDNPMGIAVQNDAIKQKEDEINVLKNASVAWVTYGETLNTTINGRVVSGIDLMCASWDNYKDTTINTLMDVSASEKVIMDKMANEEKDAAKKRQIQIDELNKMLDTDMRTSIAKMANLIGVAIGDVISGQESLVNAFGNMLGGLLKTVGDAAITLGATYLAIDALVDNPLDPGAALAVIGIGIAAVALGEILTNASKSSSSASGSSSSSSSNTFDTRGQQAGLYQNQTIELVQRGRDMVASIKLNQLYYNRQG